MDESPDERKTDARRAAFVRAGFSEADADTLAKRPEIAYLDALALVRHGFPPEVAASMLLGGQRAVY